jgi:hypothetical protein
MMTKIETAKWTGTGILILGTAVNGLGYWPWGPLMLALGGLVWGAVAIITKDRALLVTNAVMSAVGVGAVVLSLWGPGVEEPQMGSAKADEYYTQSVDKPQD